MKIAQTNKNLISLIVFLLISYKPVIIRLDEKCNVHQFLHLDINTIFIFSQ